MHGRIVAINFICTIFFQSTLGGRCDTSTDAVVHDGNMGESGIFCWLGILRVHLHDGDTTKIALTGVVLIKENFAVANADDIARIPMIVFKQESQIMFIAQNATPWYCQPRSYVTHPEYEYSTYNTIAVIELALDDVETYPLRPICWPKKMMNTSSHLYVTGYTDDNKFLEKIVYKMQYVDKTTCEQFYKKAGLSSEKRIPMHYQCAYTMSDHENCVWDNGMALVTNITGWFTLVGLGVRGPGCAAPSRYIDIYQYMQWIDLVTTLNEIDDYGGYRRAQKESSIEYIPAHELFRTNTAIKPSNFGDFHIYKYPGQSMQYFNLTQIETNAFLISIFNTTYESETGRCDVDSKKLVYHEHFKVQTRPKTRGSAAYKVTLYDFSVGKCTCVKLMIQCLDQTPATLYYTETTDVDGGESGETPEELLKTYLFNYPKGQTFKPGPHLRPVYIKSDFGTLPIPNVNLILQFEFEGEAVFKLEAYAEAKEGDTSRRFADKRRINHDSIRNMFGEFDEAKDIGDVRLKQIVFVKNKTDFDTNVSGTPDVRFNGLAIFIVTLCFRFL